MHSSAVNHATFLNLFHIMGRLVPAHNEKIITQLGEDIRVCVHILKFKSHC